MADIFRPESWYWIVGNRTADGVFSSAVPGYVPLADTNYTAWLDNGNLPSQIATDGELAHALALAGVYGAIVLAVDVTDWGGLDPKDITITAIPAAGVTITSPTIPYVNATYELSGLAFQYFMGLNQYINSFGVFPVSTPGALREGEEGPVTRAVGPPPTTYTWTTRGTTITFLNIADFREVSKGLADYLAQWNTWAWQNGPAVAFGSWQVP